MGDGKEWAEGGQEAPSVCVCVCVYKHICESQYVFVCIHFHTHICKYKYRSICTTNQLKESLFVILIGRKFLFLTSKKKICVIVSCHVVQDASTQVNEKNA